MSFVSHRELHRIRRLHAPRDSAPQKNCMAPTHPVNRPVKTTCSLAQPGNASSSHIPSSMRRRLVPSFLWVRWLNEAPTKVHNLEWEHRQRASRQARVSGLNSSSERVSRRRNHLRRLGSARRRCRSTSHLSMRSSLSLCWTVYNYGRMTWHSSWRLHLPSLQVRKLVPREQEVGSRA